MEGRREWIVDFEAELGSLLKEYDIHMSTDTPSYDLSMRDLNIIHVGTACIGWAGSNMVAFGEIIRTYL